ncbi:hypothetical protein [Sorangium atrum]|uniref:Lipoprotein n=1 Tax=Sorangium atrum TaxID=2995308 RepID=A0ABT5BY33_9BACT|nr:hypothetical protein [Sorangium aterium]MDC0679070.1 hypothetical protein [Sorangium aterium]
MASEGRRAFIAQVTAGAGLVALGGCGGAPGAAGAIAEAKGAPAAGKAAPLAPAAPAVAGAAPVLEAALRGAVLALRYRYPSSLGERLAAAPWAATLVVAIHPASASPACRSLATGALRTEAPVLDQGMFRASAEVDLAAFFGLRAPFVRYVHASFLHLRSDVLRVAAG